MSEYDLRKTAALERIAEACERVAERLIGVNADSTSRSALPAKDSPEDETVMATSFVRVQLLRGPRSWEEIVAEGAKFDWPENRLKSVRDRVAVPKKESDGRWRWHLKATLQPQTPETT